MKLRHTLHILIAILASNFVNAQEDSIRTELINLGSNVNSAFRDFAPVISADGSMMIFTSRRPLTDKEIKSGEQATERVYITRFDKATSTWSKAEALPATVNEKGRNNSAIALSNDGQKMLLYRDDKTGNGDIYESVLKGTEWSKAEKLPEPINTPAHESSAAYSPDGNTIYLVSKRDSGQGGRDIWMCTRKPGGTWGPAVNLGSVINTSADEEGVFMHPDGQTLYFSSMGHGSMGGYDVFKSVRTNGVWSTPENLGPPLNSTTNDVFFVLEANGRNGYVTSATTGGSGQEDIYRIVFTKVDKGPRLTLLKGKVYDEKTKEPVGAKLQITDNLTGELISEISSNSASGEYMVSLPAGKNYGINAEAKGYLFYSINVSMDDTANYTEKEQDIPLQKLEVGTKIVLNNIFYDFDKSTLRPESKTELDRLNDLLNSNPSMQIELSSHTDGLGSDEYNNRLSQSRAQSVVDYLTKKGISADRLTAKGYGKTQPIATNSTAEGRQLNRRTEFKVLSK